MFDRYFVRGGPEVISAITTTHEHRAPTDESIRLLREMEAKVVSNIVGMATLKNNLMEVTYFVIEPTPMFSSYMLIVTFKLNGETITIDTELAKTSYDKMDSIEELGLLVRDIVAEKIANNILKNMSTDTIRQFDRFAKSMGAY